MAAVRVRGANDNHRQLLRTRAGGAFAVLGQDSTRTETGKLYNYSQNNNY